MNVELGFTLALYGLLLIPLVLLLGRKSQFLLSPKRRVVVVTLRVLVVVLVVLAVADVRVGLPTDELAVTTVIDSSASIADAERGALDVRLAAVAESSPDVDFDTVGRAAGPNTGQPRLAAPPTTAELATGITTAAATLAADRVRRMILATDGRDVGDDVLGAVRDAANAGVRVDVLPLGTAPPIDALALSALDAPRLVRAGETLEIEVEVSAGRAADVEFTAEIDGVEVATTTASVGAGDGRVSISVPFPGDEGIHRLEVAGQAPGDIVSANDSLSTLVRVLAKPRVLHLHDEDSVPPLGEALEVAELDVTSLPVGAAPTTLVELDRYGLVVLDEVDPERLSEPQQVAIRRFVEDLGGGLITITGGHPVKRSPEIIRQLEPIHPAPAIPEPRPLELILVIDRSGSMEGARISMARRAGVAAIAALRADALVGVVAFSGGADRVMAPVPVFEDENRALASDFVARINAGGGTNIAAALSSARAIGSHDPRYIHHVILLSDGASDPAPALAQAQALASSGASISAITIGPRNPLMAEIARIGRGRYHVTENAASLPALFVREAQFRPP
ncbi:MAG: VWA domain-containing protein, partial [Deltaproteobacteria bacterium]|nr:VWA domain-containing protein [Deltaproteobacteria bacterium]